MLILKIPYNYKGDILPEGSPVPALPEEKKRKLIENGVAEEIRVEPQEQGQESNTKTSKTKTKGS